jgi:hypothetical protein
MMEAQKLNEALRGKWFGSYGTAPCPICQPERRRDQHALCFSIGGDGQLLAYCHKSGCDFRSILAAAGVTGSDYCAPDPVLAARRNAETLAKDVRRELIALQIWNKASPINGTPAESYLKGRGIDCRLPETLRYSPACWHGATGQAFPAMVARVDGANGFAIHRTYLRPDGSGKADIEPNKAMLGPCTGGAVRLSDAPGPLVVAEGIETALSLLCGLLDSHGAVWAALSTSGMMALNLPPQPGRIIIAPDGDEAGRGAAIRLADRAFYAGWNVSLLSIADGCDWNDILTGRAIP